MRFELHCHSWHSKGAKIPWEGMASPEEIIRHAKKIGLSGIAITDHRNTKSWEAASKEAKRQKIIFIPGVEVETLSGHLLALGISGPVKNFTGFEESIDMIHDAGGIAVAAHPFDIRGEGVKMLSLKADAVEVFNSINVDRVSNKFAMKKFRNIRIPKVAGSDAHTIAAIGKSVITTRPVHSVDGLLREILRGRTGIITEYVSMNEMVDWARGRLRKSEKEVLEYTNKNYNPAKAWLYRKLLKRFLSTSNAPWWVLGQAAVGASMAYSGMRILKY